MPLIFPTHIDYSKPHLRLRQYKYTTKLEEASFTSATKKQLRAIKYLKELHLSDYDSSKFLLARDLLQNYTKVLRRNIINNPLIISTLQKKIISLDKYVPQVRSYALTLSDSLSLRRFLHFHNLEKLTIHTENAWLHASNMELKNEWFYIEPAMYKLKRHLRGLSKLKQITIRGPFNLISKKMVEIVNHCLPSLDTFALSLVNGDSSQKDLSDYSIYRYLTRLDLQEMQNMKMTSNLLQHTQYLQKLQALSLDCDSFQENDFAVLKNISKLAQLSVLKANFCLASEKDWNGLLESIALPASLESVSLSVSGGINMDQLTESTGKDWETQNPYEKNATCEKFFAEWAQLKDLRQIEIKMEWTKFKSWYLSFIVGWLKRLKALEELVLQIMCPEFEEIFYDKFSTFKDDQALNFTYFYSTLEKTLCSLNRLVIHTPFMLFTNFPAQKSLGQLREIEIRGKLKGEGIENFLQGMNNLESLEVNWISLNSEESLNSLASALLNLEKLYTIKLVLEAGKVKNERLFERMACIAKRTKALVIRLESLQGTFTETQFSDLGSYLLDVGSRKQISIQTKSDAFSYYPELKSYNYNISGKFGKSN